MRAEENRILVVAPVGQDAQAMAAMLRGEGLTAEACAGAGECLDRLQSGAGAVLLTEEALDLPGAEELLESFKRQPAWSELPLIILTSGGESRFERLLEVGAEVVGGMTLLERPMREGTLLRMVQVALGSRQRQYEVRDLIAERERTAEALRESEERYRSLFTWINEAFALKEAVLDGEGRVVDFRFVEVNPAFYRQSGLADVVGKTMREVMPNIEEQWIERFAEVVRTGKGVRFQDRLSELGRWFEVFASRVGEAPSQRVAVLFSDITERKRAEEALRAAEAKYRIVADNTYDWEFWLDPEGGFVYCSPSCERITGHVAAEFVADPGLRPRLIHPEDRAMFDQHACDIEQQRAMGEREWRYVRPDGTACWVAHVCQPVFDEQGAYLGVRGSNRDITERKKAELALRESEERLQLALRATNDAIWDIDLQTGIIRWNGVYEKRFGRPPETGDSWQWWIDHIHPEDRERTAQVLRAAVDGDAETWLCEYRFRCADGAWADIYDRAYIARDGGGKGRRVIGAMQDITERKRAELALRESERMFSELVERAPFGIYIVDSKFRITHMNIGSQDAGFRNVRPVIGRDLSEVMRVLWHEPVAAEIIASFRHTLETGEPYYSPRFFNPRRDVEMVEGYEWELHRMRLPDGQHGVICYYFDSTKLREAEAVLARGKEELEGLVAERTAELREMVAELEHFSYSITHDMRAPLRAMMGFAEAAKELCPGAGDEEQKGFLRRIQTAARRMDLLIKDALNYSKAVRSELPLAPMDAGRLLREMLDTYPELQVAQGAIRIEPELPLVMGNEAGLTQCFSNLLGNAVKFAKPGEAPQIRVWAQVVDGSKLIVDRSAPTAQLSTLNSQPQQWVRIWVEDRGIGIGPKMLPRVFDMFSRGSSEEAGTGIGLALVRKVVERMGGRVGVESEQGRGSRFWVELRSGNVMGKQ